MDFVVVNAGRKHRDWTKRDLMSLCTKRKKLYSAFVRVRVLQTFQFIFFQMEYVCLYTNASHLKLFVNHWLSIFFSSVDTIYKWSVVVSILTRYARDRCSVICWRGKLFFSIIMPFCTSIKYSSILFIFKKKKNKKKTDLKHSFKWKIIFPAGNRTPVSHMTYGRYLLLYYRWSLLNSKPGFLKKAKRTKLDYISEIKELNIFHANEQTFQTILRLLQNINVLLTHKNRSSNAFSWVPTITVK